MADQQSPWGANLSSLIEKGEGPGQAATGLSRRVVFYGPQESLDLGELVRTGLVVGQGLAKGTFEEASIFATEQQGAGGSRKGNSPNLLLPRQGNPEEKLEEALSPGLGVLERSGVGGGLLLEGVP